MLARSVCVLLVLTTSMVAATSSWGQHQAAFMSSSVPVLSGRASAVALPLRGNKANLAKRSLRASSALVMQSGGLYNNDEKPRASKEILQVRFSKADPAALKTWLNKWPKGGAKDGYGLPKLMLPVSTEECPQGLKIVFKGSLDPWLQIELEGDTVRVYRCSMLSTNSLQVSALKEREEKKICDKLKEDLGKVDGASEMKEFDIPVIKPKVEEEPKEQASEETKAEEAS